jgi:hypothetical protein
MRNPSIRRSYMPVHILLNYISLDRFDIKISVPPFFISVFYEGELVNRSQKDFKR